MTVQDCVRNVSSTPRMTSDSDLALVEEVLNDLAPDATLVELGPWLGGVSEVLARAGQLHVVDSFIWTADHAKRVPGLLEKGDSFRGVFENLMAERGVEVTAHEATFEAFRWQGGPIAFCMIDSPKKPEALADCLRAVATGLGEGSRLVIKNANAHGYFEMMDFVQDLITAGAMRLLQADPEGGCNSLALEVNVDSAELLELLEQPIEPARLSARKVDGGLGHLGAYQLGLIARLVERGLWGDAYEVLARMEASRRILRDWDRLEPDLARSGIDPEQLAWFSEIMAVQHAKGGLPPAPKSFKASAALSLRAFWINNADKPWRARAFHPDVIERAHAFGYMNWANQVQDHVRGQSVLDVGCGPGLHGLGYLAAGAKSYLGLDPIIDLDRDRVKNLSARSQKMAFGWTPAELGRMLEPWEVRPDPIQDLPDDRVFDIAVLHNVTEHLLQIDSVFEAIARRLKPGGRLLYNHHNFYAWNGHHLPPKRVSDIKPGDPDQAEMMDWGHVEYDPAPEHYIARGLNRIRLDDLIALTERFFDIEICDERPSRPETGLGRLTDEIRDRYPYLTDRDFETQNLFCLARVRG